MYHLVLGHVHSSRDAQNMLAWCSVTILYLGDILKSLMNIAHECSGRHSVDDMADVSTCSHLGLKQYRARLAYFAVCLVLTCLEILSPFALHMMSC